MAGVFYKVNDVAPGRKTWCLKVRVIRLWNMCPVEEPEKLFAMEMVLIDAE
ncbi:hypothetical protein SESBI_40859, partial [Sesbania bispinosa]